MALAQLGGAIARAIQQMSNATVVDEKVLNECLNEINRALLSADGRFHLVRDMQNNVKRIVSIDHLAAGHNKRRIIQQAIFNELCNMLDLGKPSFTPKKGKTSVIMFLCIIMTGSGKTTMCTKYAFYHQKKGWKLALVCADNFRVGAFDQLKQNATKAKIPFYGSYTESDLVKIAVEGVETFKKENCDLIIVDTSGHHKQKAALFEDTCLYMLRDMLQKPDLIVFVMDSSIGQAAFDQAQAFKQSVPVGAVIVTKMDGHAKGGGALTCSRAYMLWVCVHVSLNGSGYDPILKGSSAMNITGYILRGILILGTSDFMGYVNLCQLSITATKSPVIFIDTGEHMDEFVVLDVKPFVSWLLGSGLIFWGKLFHTFMGDWSGFMDKFHRMVPKDQQPELLQKLSEGKSTLRFLNAMFQNILKMGLMGQVFSMLLGFNSELMLKELESSNPKIMNESRIMRIARGSGRLDGEVMEMLEEYKQLAKSLSKMKGLKIPTRGAMNLRSRNMNAQHMSRVLSPQMLRQIGGMGGLDSLMRKMVPPRI
ncbi:hypothetical protein BT93_F2272 [Corymbia citriodora subsp. variegata]|nr:hypothetical protein BT93_F2272 [Corymbia citriodora subsp. variegata]